MELQTDFETIWGAHNATKRIEIAELFLTANKEEKYIQLCDKFPMMFGHNAQQTPADIEEACAILKTANALFGLARSNETVTFNDVANLVNEGLAPVFYGWGAAEEEDITATSFNISFARTIKSAPYSTWLSKASTRIKERFLNIPRLGMDFSDGRLYYGTDSQAITEFTGAQDECGEILRQLITIHLADVATTCSEVIRPEQKTYSGISTLWLGFSERLSGGRAFRCEACDKPSVAYNERRRTKFCSEACRKWKNTHPNEKRKSWYFEK